MVQKNADTWLKLILHEVVPHRQTNPISVDHNIIDSTTLANKLITRIDQRLQQRQRYGKNLVAEYFEFNFSAERDKLRVEASINHNDFERIIVDEVESLGLENIQSVEVYIYFKHNKNQLNGSADEEQLENLESPTYTSTTTIPYSNSQIKAPRYKTTSASGSRAVQKTSKKSFGSENNEADEKTDTFTYDNTMESSEDKKNLCNTNSIETTENNHVGLVNQAMTCYLNSLLQALFMTPEFRNALYNWEYKNNEKDSEANSIPYQLQRLFLNLQTSPKAAVETTSLTKSFGWDVSDSWHQHDIQELCRVMFDALEQKFKNTDQRDLINQLYEGKINDYVKCLSCNTEKSREDTFLDIPLPVRPFDNNVAYGSVEEALEAFVKYETLEGSNQYFCEKCDKKSDAHKGLKFKKFPYILTLQLKRFDFDHNTYNRIKLNDKVTFPETLNLNSFIEPTSKQESSCQEETVGNKTNDDNSMADVDITENNCNSNDILISNSNHLNNHDHDDDEGITMENGSSSSCSSHNENFEKLRKDYASAKGPYIYELFSIMIHSGSASGGHYYAYIKDFKTNKWYCFNDQIVSSITKEEIQKSYGGGTRTVYYSGVYRSSTNAYMLMYRQIDPERNTNPMETKDFPPHIKKLLEKMKNEEEQSYRDEQIHSMERRFKQTIYYRQPQGGDVEKSDILISMSYTLNEVVEAARKKFYLDYKFDNSQCRIVTYFPEYDLIDTVFEGKEDTRLDRLFSSQHMIKPLLLDVHSANEEFQDYPSEPIITKVYVIDAIDKDLVYCPKYIRAYCKQTVREYKKELAKHFSLDSNALQLYSQEIQPNKLLEDEFVFDSLGSNHVYSISATDSYDKDVTNNFLESTFYRMHERLSDVITFYLDKKDVTKEQLDNLSIPSLTEHNRDVKNQETITNHYDYQSKDLSQLSSSWNNTYSYNSATNEITKNDIGSNAISKTETPSKKDLRQDEDLRDCKIDGICHNFRSALNEIEINQSHVTEDSMDKEACRPSCRRTNSDRRRNAIGPSRHEVAGISRSLHDLDNKDKNEEWNAQETSNSEDSSLSDSDRTLVGDAPEECEFNYDNYEHCPMVMNTANEDRNYEKFFKIESLRMQNLLKVSMDMQTTEEELKRKLEAFLDIPKDYFKIMDYYTSHLDELNSMTYGTSDRLTFREDKKYTINLERILSPDEDQVAVYLLDLNSTETLTKLFTTVVRKKSTIFDVKAQIIRKELKRKPEFLSYSNVPLERWRFMEIENDVVGKILDDDDKVLPEYMREICIQLIGIKEYPRRIYAVKWNSSKVVMTRCTRDEIVLEENEDFCEQIKKKLSEASLISIENLEFCPLVASKDIDMNKIESAEWKSEIAADEFDFKTLLVYRDSAEKTIPLMDAASLNSSKDSQMRSARLKARGLDAVPVSSSPRKEKALKIRVGST